LKKYLAYYLCLAINNTMSAEWLNIGTLLDCKPKTICWRRCSSELCPAPPSTIFLHAFIIACARKINDVQSHKMNDLKQPDLTQFIRVNQKQNPYTHKCSTHILCKGKVVRKNLMMSNCSKFTVATYYIEQW
jgi:hypothetical protein